MAEIKLNKRYKYAGDIFQKLVDVGLDIEAATAFLNEVENAEFLKFNKELASAGSFLDFVCKKEYNL